MYLNYTDFLNVVANWLEDRRSGSRAGLASDIIKIANSVWSGVGVYTESELCFASGEFSINSLCILISPIHLPGNSPFITEAELFDSPSRTARFCAAFYSFAHRTHNDVM